MKGILLSAIFGIVFSLNINAQCSEDEKTKVLLVGDSWAFFMGVDGTINTVFDRWGHSDVKFYTDPIIAENGAQTKDFLQQNKLDAIENRLNDNDDLEFVHLSIGGNDFLGQWDVNFTEQETEDLKVQVLDSIALIIDHIKSFKPDIKIVWSGYTYSNFEEIITDLPSLLQDSHPFYSTWEGMDYPDNETVNAVLNDFSYTISDYCENTDNVDFIMATGLMQYTYGQEDPLGVAPFGTYQAFTAPLPEGYLDYPSPKGSMRNYTAFRDCFHLSGKGYRDLISYHTQKYYHKQLMNDAYVLASNDNKTGSVSDAGTVSPDLLCGEANGEEFATILNFPTSQYLDSTAVEARIFLRREEQTGDNPIHDSILVKAKFRYFGDNAEIEEDDFYAIASEEAEPCIFGANTDENWVRIDLPQELAYYISGDYDVQFMITSPDSEGAQVKFTDASDPDFAPVLDVTYGESPFASTEIEEKTEAKVSLYPNPASTFVEIRTENFDVANISVIDISGKIISEEGIVDKINIASLNSGAYFVKIQGKNGGLVTKKLIKR